MSFCMCGAPDCNSCGVGPVEYARQERLEDKYGDAWEEHKGEEEDFDPPEPDDFVDDGVADEAAERHFAYLFESPY